MAIRMPDPPSVSPITRYLFENPIPPAALALLVAAVLLVTGLRRGDLRRQGLGLAVLLLCGLLVGLDALVVTSGERAAAVTRRFVEAAVAEDLVGAMNLVADDAALGVGAPTAEGFDRDTILTLLSTFAARYSVTSNRISSLRGYRESSRAGVAHLTCVTEVDAGYGPNATQWVFAVARQEDGTWKITRITWMGWNGQAASRGYLER